MQYLICYESKMHHEKEGNYIVVSKVGEIFFGKMMERLGPKKL